MAIATGARHSVAYGLQNDFDATMTTLTELRVTDCSLAPTREEFESAEIQSHGQVVDTRQGMHQASGDISFELSYGTFDDFFAGICRSSWVTNSESVSAATIAAVAATSKLTDSASGFGGFSAGDWVKVAFASTTANNGVYEVSVASAAELTLAGASLTDAAAGENVTVEGMDILKVGASEKYFTIERTFADIGTYEVYEGCAVGSANLTIQPNQLVTGSFSLVGKDMTATGSALCANPGSAPSGDPISGIDVGSILEGGASIANVSGVNLTIEGATTAKPVVGSNAAGFMAWTDAFRITGSVDAYFENNALMNKFLGEAESSLRVVLEDPDGAVVGFELPRIKYTGNSSPTSGRDTIMQSAQIKGLYDEAEATSVTFFRKSA